jgi:putative transposase
VRIARALNGVMGRRGRVLSDRYHARILRTPSEVARVRNYLRTNARRHYGLLGRDPYASYAPFVAPPTWLVRRLE